MNKHIFEITISLTQISSNVSFENISERYRNIEMSQLGNGKLLLTITKRITNPIKISIDEAKNEANELVDRLALLPNHDITDLVYLGYKNENDVLIKEKKSVTVSGTLIGVKNNPTEFYNRTENKRLLEKIDNVGVLRTFRVALGISDNISQFLILYGLLQVLVGEKQSLVDDFIKKEIKDIRIVSGKYGNETIITNIRNMIAHPENGLDMNNLNENVNNYILEIKQLVLNELRK